MVLYKKKRFQTLKIASLIIMVILFIIICSGCTERPRHMLQSSIISPDGKHSLNVYQNDGGATVDYSITVSITDLEARTEWNIYFRYHLHEIPEHYWITNDTIFVDDHQLNIFNDYIEVFDR